MKRVRIIGIGAGDPDHLTVQAAQALNEVDVFFVADKGDASAELAALRAQICERFIGHRSYRIACFADPERASDGGSYHASVAAWHVARADVYARLIAEELTDGQCGAFLAWGDPTLYDSTLRILDELRARPGADFDYDVVPGVSSVAALAARHRIAQNRIGEPVHITTGRKLAEHGIPPHADSVIVMLDGQCAFRKLEHDASLDIYWGAYLGTPDEILIAGPLAEVAAEIERTRTRARLEKGWILDIYLLRRR